MRGSKILSSGQHELHETEVSRVLFLLVVCIQLYLPRIEKRHLREASILE